LLALVGCVADGPDTTDVARVDPTAADVAQEFPPNMVVVVINPQRDAVSAIIQPRLHNSLDLDLRMGVVGSGPTDPGPCGCDGPSCLDSWAAENLGCDVCAVFVCGGHNVHACHYCD